ncbi:MAG: CRISPR system precrRNA processing endoribonuclease RAMP protein Cas6, partial [Ktedonobacteraceae bacterium]|nr:CRISPR system precrRNA processing endoribonuclease RAMP protein Cas6 [Ktedonobacteraceae bacterium]
LPTPCFLWPFFLSVLLFLPSLAGWTSSSELLLLLRPTLALQQPRCATRGYLHMQEVASQIRILQDDTRWMEVQSYSTRQHQTMPIGGFVGRASFVGDMTNVRELLVWGEVLRVGKNIVKGGGRYCIEV